MRIEVLASLTSLAGVALGGVLSFAMQYLTQRSKERMDDKAHRIATAQARREERITVLDQFIAASQDAERCANSRVPGWAEGDEWHVRTHAVLDRLWVAERAILLRCPVEVYEAARAYAGTIRDLVWEPDDSGRPAHVRVSGRLDATRHAFLDAARSTVD